jgi:hypothetical protein
MRSAHAARVTTVTTAGFAGTATARPLGYRGRHRAHGRPGRSTGARLTALVADGTSRVAADTARRLAGGSGRRLSATPTRRVLAG